jgi:hypothetical protein
MGVALIRGDEPTTRSPRHCRTGRAASRRRLPQRAELAREAHHVAHGTSPMTLRLKPVPSPPPPFSWDIPPPSPPDAAALPSSPAAWLSAKDMRLYGSHPLSSTSDIGVVKCKDCAKPVLRSFISDHSSQSALPPHLDASSSPAQTPAPKSAQPTSRTTKPRRMPMVCGTSPVSSRRRHSMI